MPIPFFQIQNPGGLLVRARGGTADRSLRDRYADTVNVRDYGATGDGATDDTAALVAAVAALPASGGTLFFPPGEYRGSATLTITKPRTRVSGYGAKLTITAHLTTGVKVEAAEVVVEGLEVYSPNGAADWQDWPAPETAAIGVYLGPAADGAKLLNSTVSGFGYTQVRVTQSKDVEVRGNTLVGIGAAGGLIAGSNSNLAIDLYGDGLGYKGVRLVGNSIRDTAQGIFTYYSWEDLLVANNTIRDIIGQHGMYLGGLKNAVIANNIVGPVGHNGIKMQVAASTPAEDRSAGRYYENIAFIGNAIHDTGQAGIIVMAGVGGLPMYMRNVSIAGNVIQNTTNSGIDVDQAQQFTVTGNRIDTTADVGIRLRGGSKDGVVSGNTIRATARSGIYALSAADSLTIIENNRITDPVELGAGAGASDSRSGIYVSTGEWLVRDNVITAATPANLSYAISTHAAATVTLLRNRLPAVNSSVPGTLVLDTTQTEAVGAPGVTVTPNVQGAHAMVVTAATGDAFTIAAPVNRTSETDLTVTISNTSGGALGAVAWNGAYKLAAWASPATGFSRSVAFRWNGTTWTEVGRTPADVPN